MFFKNDFGPSPSFNSIHLLSFCRCAHQAASVSALAAAKYSEYPQTVIDSALTLRGCELVTELTHLVVTRLKPQWEQNQLLAARALTLTEKTQQHGELMLGSPSLKPVQPRGTANYDGGSVGDTSSSSAEWPSIVKTGLPGRIFTDALADSVDSEQRPVLLRDGDEEEDGESEPECIVLVVAC